MTKKISSYSKKVLAASLAAMFLSVPFTGVVAAASHDHDNDWHNRPRYERRTDDRNHQKWEQERRERWEKQRQERRDHEKLEKEHQERRDKERRDHYEHHRKYEEKDNGKHEDVRKRNRAIATGVVVGGILGAIIANNS